MFDGWQEFAAQASEVVLRRLKAGWVAGVAAAWSSAIMSGCGAGPMTLPPPPDPAWQAGTTIVAAPRPASLAAIAAPVRVPRAVAAPARSLRKGGGYRKIGKPYHINGVRYVPRHDPNYAENGKASWYGDAFHGKKTANGEIYDMYALTAAHRTLPLPSLVVVTNLENGRKVIVRINDRGPFKKGRIIDVSSRVAEELGFRQQGTADVEVTYLGPAPLDGGDRRERMFLASQKK